MTIALAPLSQATLSATARIWHEGWHAAHAPIVPEALTRLRTLADFERRLNEHEAQTTLAMSGDEVVGFVIVVKDELYQMFLDQKAYGTGVAGVLMQNALAQISANGAQTAWLSCSIGNARAEAFYKKCGWIDKGQSVVSVDTSAGPFDLSVLRFEKPL